MRALSRRAQRLHQVRRIAQRVQVRRAQRVQVREHIETIEVRRVHQVRRAQLVNQLRPD